MQFKPGDIAACYGTDWTSRLIRWGTASVWRPRPLQLGPSHVALMFEWRGEMIWGESTTLCPLPCLVREECVAGAQAHLPQARIKNYTDAAGRVDVYRLTHFNRLSIDESRLLTRLMLDEFIVPGVGYDTGGAILSGTRAFQLMRCFPYANFEELFCSELVAALVMRLNRMNHSNPTRFHPARLLNILVRTGKYELIASLGRDQ